MALTSKIDYQNFLDKYWQLDAFLFKQAFNGLDNIVDGNELASLACEEQVESRIISGHGLTDDWQCQHGPFSEKKFKTLGDCNWTLLIQGLDQWNARAAKLLDEFTFLPKWRLEDIMASYAPIGGGVGPHFDYYDVFLIQVSGTREWQLGQNCDNTSRLQNNDEVKLLAEFNTQETYQVTAGGMLYIPAGMAHWGTAITNDCITLSIGFRAPSKNEVLIEALQLLIEDLSKQDYSERYRDEINAIDDNIYKINSTALKSFSDLPINLDPIIVERAFGQLVTEQRHYDANEEYVEVWRIENLTSHLANNPNQKLILNRSSRFAFTENYLFVDGEQFITTENFSAMICNGVINRSLDKKELTLLLQLINQDAIQIEI